MSEPADRAPERAAGARQRTIRREASLSGVGLHSGATVRVRLRGGAPGTGIIFRRINADGGDGRVMIRAAVDAVRDTTRGVTLGNGWTVATVEHLLSAAAGLGVDNLEVDVDGPELPALDGSARDYAGALEGAGISEQEAPARVVPLRELRVALGQAVAFTRPDRRLTVTYQVDLPAPLGRQVAAADVERGYREGIAPARTWGFADEAEALRLEGRARGASLDNVLAIGPEGYLTPPRFPDEPARHKILDLIGDLALLGVRLRGHISVARGGHALHLALAREIARWMTEA